MAESLSSIRSVASSSLLLITCMFFFSPIGGCKPSAGNGDSEPKSIADSSASESRTGAISDTTGKAVSILAWVGYDEQDFREKLEQRAGVRVKVKTYVGGDKMYSLFTSAPSGTYDLVVVDREYGSQLFAEGALSPIDQSLRRKGDLLEPFASTSVAEAAGSTFAIPLRWGALGLVYNTQRVSPAEASSYEILFDKRVAGRVAVFDWYLPNMAVLSRYLSDKYQWSHGSSFALTRDQLNLLTETLVALRHQVRSVQPSTGDVIASLRSGAAWIAPGVGEWAAATLQAEGLPIEWVVPSEGGVMWIEALALTPQGAARPEARKVFEVFQDPEILASLMWRDAYVSQSPSREAYSFLTDNQKRILKAQNLAALESLAKDLEIRRLPGPVPAFTGADEWQASWQRFKTP